MRIYVVSDLHLETGPSWSIPEQLPDFDVAVIAGDLHCPVARSIEQIASAPVLQGKPVVFVPGNHEFDGGVLQDVLADGLGRAVASNCFTGGQSPSTASASSALPSGPTTSLTEPPAPA